MDACQVFPQGVLTSITFVVVVAGVGRSTACSGCEAGLPLCSVAVSSCPVRVGSAPKLLEQKP